MVDKESESPERLDTKNDVKEDRRDRSDDLPEDDGEDIPREYKSALKKADTYANKMHMSKAGLYKQLVSEYGEQFSEEAAKYAVDNVDTNWKENALQKAINYQDSMAMSPNAIYDQLTSEHGEQFTNEEAEYAIDNLPK